MRTHVVIPRDLVQYIDRLVGRRARIRFLAEAAEEKLRRVRQRIAMEKVAGSLKDVDIPVWETPQAVTEWVTNSRTKDGRTADPS